MKPCLIVIKKIFLCCLVSVLSGCDNQSNDVQTEERLRPVKTIIIGSSKDSEWREFPGVVDAFQKAELSFSVSGKLAKLSAKEGDAISAGQELAQLDQSEFKTKLLSKQADYDKAKADFNRAESLIKNKHISQSDYDKLKAQYEAANANLAIAKQNLDNTVLRAAFAGFIAKRHVDNFEEISAKQPIYSIQDTSQYLVKMDVPESVMIKIKRDKKRKIFAIFESVSDKNIPLVFYEVSAEADKNTNTYQVTFTMSAVEGLNVLPGMSVTIRGEKLPSDTTNKLIAVVPAEVVMQDQEGRYVYIVKSSDDGVGEIIRKNITIGKMTNTGLEIVSGLNNGDQVVTAGMSKIFPGLRVKLDK